MKSTRRTLLWQISLLMAVTFLLTGLTWTGGKITWTFLLPWSSADYDSFGIPKPSAKSPTTGKTYVFKDPDFNHPSFVNFLAATLPEGVNQSTSPLLTSSGIAKNIIVDRTKIVDPTQTVEVSFISEGSSFRNSLGYFLYDAANPPTSKTDSRILHEAIVFPNTSFFNSGGSAFGLRSGDAVFIDLTPVTSRANPPAQIGVGFFLVSDGFPLTNSGKTFPVEGVRSTAVADWIFHTIAGMNTEAAPLNEHTVLLKSPDATGPAVGLIALAMEETNRDPAKGASDHDFNDVIYGIKVFNDYKSSTTHANATMVVNFASIYPPAAPPDTDGDGVPDSLDEFPNDAQRATSNWYPSKTGWNTLAYEDLWPASGDYDMNDLVVNYRHRVILKSTGEVKEIELHYQLMAAGARYRNGFAIEFTGIGYNTSLASALMSVNNGTATNVSPMTPNSYLVFKIFDDAFTQFTPVQSGITNTVKGTSSVTGNSYQLNIAFATPRALSTFTNAPLYNPFLFRTVDPGLTPGLEVHLPGRPPTSNADTTLFGTEDDGTVPGKGPYYVSNNKNGRAGYPWALDIPQGWKWPTEKTDIVTAYPNFAAWVQSGGTLQTTWYLSPNGAKVYP